MTRSMCYLGFVLVLVSAGAAVIASSAEGQREARVRVAKEGIVHVPAFDLPLSSYMSEEAKRAVIEALVSTKSAQDPSDRKDLSISDIRAQADSALKKMADRASARYPVNVEERRFGEVPTLVVTPKDGVPISNRRRVLINLHGGGLFQGAGAGGLVESIPLAGLGKFKVVTVDYREGPEFRFPAASEDTATVYRELLMEYKPRNIGIYGCSSGGVLTAMAVAWFQKHKLPTPGAIVIVSAGAFGGWYAHPSVPGSWSGDSAYIAPPINGQEPMAIDPKLAPALPAYMSAYLSAVDLTDPMVSPALSPSVLARFPPVLLITGTRAPDMSAAVQTQRALTKTGVLAELHLWDGMGHCFVLDTDLPESQEAFAVMTRFFDAELSRHSRR